MNTSLSLSLSVNALCSLHVAFVCMCMCVCVCVLCHTNSHAHVYVYKRNYTRAFLQANEKALRCMNVCMRVCMYASRFAYFISKQILKHCENVRQILTVHLHVKMRAKFSL